VRYNQVQYNRRDIEEAIAIPARDRLIVDTYLHHVPNRKAVAFAVNVRHGEDLAEEFRRSGVPAQSVSGRMPNREREETLRAFHDGRVRVLCACDILNEGWDCPDIEVLLMARPTLSRVLYLQQLGRGTRKAPGKECLVVFDFVDNASRYNQSLSAHRVLGKTTYRPGGLLLAPPDLLAAEEAVLARGERPTAVLEIGLWAKDYEPIDVFNWQQDAASMISLPDLERELAVAEGRVRSAVERGQVKPDHVVPLGERTYFYFHRDRIEDVRVAVGAPKLEEHTLRDRFLEFIRAMDMALSYKPVMLLALLDTVDEEGRARASEVAQRFQQFYRDRREAGLIVERPGSRKVPVDELDETAAQRLMLPAGHPALQGAAGPEASHRLLTRHGRRTRPGRAGAVLPHSKSGNGGANPGATRSKPSACVGAPLVPPGVKKWQRWPMWQKCPGPPPERRSRGPGRAPPGGWHPPPPALPAQGGSVPAAPATVRTNPKVLVTASAVPCGTNRPGSVAWIAVSSSASRSPIRRLERSAVSSRNRFR
jgi:hypothetical protein